MSERLRPALEHRNIKLICAAPNCKKPIKPNGMVVSIRGYKSRRISYYPAECYE
jgi:hypothetical protein